MPPNPYKILAIVDDTDSLMILKAVTADAFPDAVLSAAPNGRAGLDLALVEDPDVILLDIFMPEMDEYAVCRLLKQDDLLRNIPVVFLTALKSGRESRIKALESGADGFLSKPLVPEELTAQIRAMARIKAAQLVQRDDQKRLAEMVDLKTRELKQFHKATLNLLEDLQTENENRRRTEKELRESEEKFRSITEQTSDFIALTDKNGFLTYASSVSKELFNYTADEMLGRHFTEFVGESAVPGAVAAFRETIQSGKRIKNFEVPMMRKGGPEIIGEVNGSRFRCGDQDGSLVVIRDITARKQSEDALRKSEEKYRGIFESVQDVYYEVSEDGTILEISPSIEIMSRGQYREDDLIGKSMWNFYTGEGERQRLLETLREHGEITDYEIRLKNRDGSPIPCSISSKFRLDPQGKQGRIVGSMRDMTERKRAESALLENERKYRTLVDQSPEGIFIIDLKGSFVSINKAMCESLHYSEEELLTMSIMDIMAPDYLKLHHERLRRILREGGIKEAGEYLVRGKDGMEHYIEVRSVPYLKENRIVGIQGIAHDVSDRRKAEEALRESQQRYKTLLESINDYTYSVGIREGRPVNTVHGFGCEKVTGFTPSDYSCIPDLWIRMVHPDDRNTVEHYADPLCEGRKIPPLEHRILHKNGSVIWVRNTYVLKHDAGGKVIGYDGLISDITERKKMDNALRRSEEAQRHFSERLTNTLEAINDLSKSKTFDDLCRNAVVFAKRLMNFDRFGIWFFLPDHRTMRGSFGTDQNGNLQDERSMSLPIVERHIRELVPSKKPIVLFEDEDLRDFRGNIVGRGSHVVAGLWNGEEIIGLIGTDNLIGKHPILENDTRLLNLYSASLGHLFTLKRAEDRIRNDLEEKNVMLKEIHHRVRNNLNVITSLLSLQSDRIATKEEALAAFEESRNRIYAMALVHSNLYKEEDFSRIDLTSFVQNLTQNLSQVYRKDVKIDLQIEDISLDLNNAVPCGLILNELVTNSLKHAFPGKSKGVIRIVFRILKGNTCEMTVQDDGAGLPKAIDVRKSKSLGLLIINQLVDQIDGRLEIKRKGGTVFQIKFPVRI
jgi:PAS domain S-box-containing protein